MSSYKYASVVQLVEDDPANSATVGDIRLIAGQHEDTYSYTVHDDEKHDFVDVECEVIHVLEAPERMNKKEITQWAANQDEAVEAAQEAAA